MLRQTGRSPPVLLQARPEPALAVGIGAGPVVGTLSADLHGLVHAVERVPFPLGALLVGLVVVLLLYVGVERFRTWTLVGRPPYLPPTDGVGAHGSRVPLPPLWTGGTDDEGVLPDAGPVAPSPPPSPPTASRAAPVRWTLEGGDQPFEVPPATFGSVGRPPPSSGFARRLVGVFLVLAIALVVLRHYIFFVFDRIVEAVGQVMFWPLPWPGLVLNSSIRRVVPDFIFLVYLSLMLSFCLVTGLYTQDRFSRAQRRTATHILLSYTVTAIGVDVFAFIFADRLVSSAFLLLRGLVGGVFFALLLFSSLSFPAPIQVERRFPRDPSAARLFFGSAAAAVAATIFVLFLLFRYAGLGRALLPFAILLLLPQIALTIWGLIGRALYEAELVRRPRPTVEQFHPAVSVLIPAFNEEKGLAAAVASVDAAARLYPGPTEIIVANDGSADGTGSVARRAIGSLRHATGVVLDLPHRGKSGALNGGLAAATGKIIVRIDADSRMSGSRGFGAMVPHLADPEVGGVQGMILPLQLTGWTGKLRLMEIAWNHLFLRRATMATRATQVVDGAFCAFRRADLVAAGGWVPWNGEDTEITLRLQRAGFRMRFEPGAASFEDVPDDLEGLRKQRIRWNRGGLFAHRRHMASLFGDAFEFGGLAILLWFAFFARNGLRGLVWAYAALVTLLVGLPTLYSVALITLVLLVPRGAVIGYYFVSFGRGRLLPFIATWPVTGAIKQYFSLESIGSMLPGSLPEFSE